MSASSVDSSRSNSYTLPEDCWPWKDEQVDDWEEAWPPEHLFYIDDEKWCPWIDAEIKAKSGTKAKEEPVAGPSGVKPKEKKEVVAKPSEVVTMEGRQEELDSDWSWRTDATPPGVWMGGPERVQICIPPLPPLVNLLRGVKLPAENYGRVRDRFPKIKNYRVIEVVEYDEHHRRHPGRSYPTEWLAISNPYWRPIRESAPREYTPQWSKIFNNIDNIWIDVQRQPNMNLLAKRCGVTAVIEYADGGTGGIIQPTPLEMLLRVNPPTNRRPKEIEYGVPTPHIPRGSPYWRRLLFNILQPKTGLTIRVASDVDGVKNLIMLESDGSISISRLYQRVSICGPLSPGELREESIPWGGEEEDSD